MTTHRPGKDAWRHGRCEFTTEGKRCLRAAGWDLGGNHLCLTNAQFIVRESRTNIDKLERLK